MIPMDDATAVATMTAILAEHEAWLERHIAENAHAKTAKNTGVCDKMEPTEKTNAPALLEAAGGVAPQIGGL